MCIAMEANKNYDCLVTAEAEGVETFSNSVRNIEIWDDFVICESKHQNGTYDLFRRPDIMSIKNIQTLEKARDLGNFLFKKQKIKDDELNFELRLD
jgi:hypothetical protein